MNTWITGRMVGWNVVARAGCVVAAWAGVVGFAGAQPVISSLGVLPFGGYSVGTGVSAGGAVVVGFGNGPSPRQGFSWTGGGLTNLGMLPGGSFADACGVSGDGRVIVGSSDSSSGIRGFRWSTSAGLESLGLLRDGSNSFALAASLDGQVIAGFAGSTAGDEAFRWTPAGGMQGLGWLAGGTRSYAFGISGDGVVVVGCSDNGAALRAVRWVGQDIEDLGVAMDARTSTAMGASGDGRVVVGSGFTPAGTRAFRWVQGEGAANLGVIPNTAASFATGVTADGLRVVGYCNTPGGNVATLWTPAMGVVDLSSYLASQGVNLAGWQLFEARAISPDGSAITGFGFHNGLPRGWVVTGIGGCVAPGVSLDPVDVTACRGGSVTLTVLAQGTGPLAYHWRRGGVPLDLLANPSAATATLVIAAASDADAGSYDCEVTGACGSDVSEAASLTICAADFNCSGAVSVQDIFDFLAAYFADDPRADFNNSSIISVQDIFDFLAAYFAGCL